MATDFDRVTNRASDPDFRSGMTDLDPLFTIGYSHLYRVDNAIVYRAGMNIDADGSPHAYNPVSKLGLDALANAGKPGNWWGIATDQNGTPYVQDNGDPAPGFYVSTTALEDTTKSKSNPARYVNSALDPFIVLPSRIGMGLKLGDYCLCFNTSTGDNNYGIYADIGPNGQIGEASIAMADSLRVPSNARYGGVASGILYWVMPGSGKGFQHRDTWFGYANATFKKWGGLSRLKDLEDHI